ncbi:MAG TPA: hypothetical protein VKV20_10425 [Ktedonobacteraceae bacterium]|jgi:hypothetical protein|nr:hypothetical protein [Ktedonobacteraceae bacterium]
MNRLKLTILSGVLLTVTIIAALLLSTGQIKAVGAVGVAPSLKAKCGSWNLVPSPNATTGDNALGSVAAISSSDIWAVGNAVINPDLISQTLTEHWNGTSWSVVSSPNAGSSDNFLLSVATVSTSDVWAVGNYLNSNGIPQTLIEHWNGTAWNIVSSPNVGASDNLLFGLTAISSNDVWAVGYYQDETASFRTLIEHWDGTSWKVVSSPNIGSSNNLLYAITALSASDVVAVGQYLNTSGPGEALIEQWNGTRWSVVSSPKTGSASNVLLGITVTTTGNLWAAGEIESDSKPLQTLTEQQNGTHWSIVSSPDAGSADNKLFGISAISNSSIWAAGNYLDKAGNAQTLIEEWNGAHWLIMHSPSPGSGDNILGAIVALSPNDVWAVGGYDNGGSTRTLIEHYC